METYQNCMQQTTEYKHADGSGASPIAERYRKNKLNRQFFQVDTENQTTVQSLQQQAFYSPKKKKKIYLILVPSKEKILKTTGRAEQLNRHLSSQQKIIPDVKINVKHRNIHICIVPFQHSLISTGSDDQTARHNAYMLDNVWTSQGELSGSKITHQ